MLDGGVSRRYAKALFDVALEGNEVDSIEDELRTAHEIFTSDVDVMRFWTSSTIQPQEKHNIIDSTLAVRGMSKTMVNFLKLVVDKNRESSINGILLEYSRLADEHRRIQDIEVKTATELSDEAKEKIQKKLETMTGRRVRLDVSVVPALVGGIVIRIGDHVIDGSIATRLEALKQTMVSNM